MPQSERVVITIAASAQTFRTFRGLALGRECKSKSWTRCSFKVQGRVVAIAIFAGNGPRPSPYLAPRTSDAASSTRGTAPILDQVNAQEFNIKDAYGFVPYIFDADSMRCIANGRNAVGFSNLTLEEMALSLGVTTTQDGLSEEVLLASAEDSDGWFKFNFVSEDFDGEPVSFLGYANRIDVIGHSYVIVAGFAHRYLPRPPVETCPTTVNRLCNIVTAQSLVGAALYSAMTADTPAELRETWNDITFSTDTTYQEGGWYVFAYGFGENFTSGAFAHKRSDWIEKTLFDISLSIVPDVSKQNGTRLHEHFVAEALSGGGWASYDWAVSSTATAQEKVSYVAGLRRFGNDYYVGAGFNHIRDPAAESALCGTCSVEYSEPCAMSNVLTLAAHAQVDILTRSEEDGLFVGINNVNSEEYIMPGGFGVLIVDYATRTVMADTVDASLVGADAAAAFAVRHIGEVSTADAKLKDLADLGGGWLELAGEDNVSSFAAFVQKLVTDDNEYYLILGYRRERAPVTEACSSMYSAPCSEISSQALIGEIVTDIQLASSDAEVSAILVEINAGNVTVGPDFYPIILDENLNIVAHGDVTAHQGWNMSDPQPYVDFLQQTESVTSLGDSFEANVVYNAFKLGGGTFSVSWNDAFGSSVDKIVSVQAARQVSAADGGVTWYYVMTMYIDAPAPTLCSDGCPANGYCTEEDSSDGLPARCECGFYYTAVYADASNETCASTLTRNLTMTCEVDEDKAGVSSIKLIARVLGGMNSAFALGCIVWTIAMRNNAIVRASQPVLLILVGFGTMTSSMTNFVMAVDDSVGPAAGEGKNDLANWACMAQPWFYGIGFAITFSTMIVKLRRVVKVFRSAARMKKARGVSLKTAVQVLIFLVAIEAIGLLAWTLTDPLQFVRPSDDPLNGACESPHSSIFVWFMAAYHLGLLMYGAVLSYQCRKVNGVFAEAKYLSLAMVSNLQILVLALPVIKLTANDEQTSMFIRAIAIFLNDFSTCALIFCPKVYFCIFGPPESSGFGTSALKPKSRSRAGVSRTQVASVTQASSKVTSNAPETKQESLGATDSVAKY
ncbi:Metabotropic glutamate receptor-like protein E [Hondaea fermentalgiana]|uniref:Metabotropic glutamate receptor-like protein E n=1 Tax=Hondaea fermentalgiana TaxID=2315210 RepID=A0A2R5GN11_9STRA|nr:Metabotropic glutamate receptor-like protein E [Hondaea fermentalgiana]|eukprot:GBG32280.1 Metabotropic glutamate receptor-like protein E [Hondaea fermentalgiana]